MHRRPLTLLLLPSVLCVLSQIAVVFSSVVNCSIDDTLGDTITGQRPTFLPSTNGIWEDQTCSSCRAKPPISSAFDRTYTAATYKPGNNISISFDFTGIAIYIFFILSNSLTTAANFTLDGSIAGMFTYSPTHNDPAFQFNDSALAFSKTGLENASHQMVISTSGISDSVWVNFDYALYTFEEAVATTSSAPSSSPSSSSASDSAPSSSSSGVSPKSSGSSAHVGAIVGGIVSGLVALGALVAVLFFFCRCGRRQQHQRDVAPFVLPAPSSQQWQNVDDRETKLRQMRQQKLERQMRVINEENEDLRNEATEHADADAGRMTDTNAWAQGLSDEPPPYFPRTARATAGEWH